MKFIISKIFIVCLCLWDAIVLCNWLLWYKCLFLFVTFRENFLVEEEEEELKKENKEKEKEDTGKESTIHEEEENRALPPPGE